MWRTKEVKGNQNVLYMVCQVLSMVGYFQATLFTLLILPTGRQHQILPFSPLLRHSLGRRLSPAVPSELRFLPGLSPNHSKMFCSTMAQSNRKKHTFRGEPAVFFSKKEISKLPAPLKYTLVGKFYYHRPKMEIIRKFFISLGLRSLQSVGLLQENHIAIFITQEEDYTRMLLRSTWYVVGAPMKVLKWSPDFYPSVESPVVPMWVGFPGLPLHFFEKSALFYIASVLGTPLKIDEPTAKMARPTIARVCIEVDVSKPRNRRIWLGDEKEGYWQDIIFENPPQYCDFCKALGHDISTCHKKNPELLQEPKKVSGIEKTSMEKNRNYGLPVKNFEREKIKDIWKRKEAEPVIVEPKHTEGWTVVEGKKKNKLLSELSIETAEKATVEGKMEKTHSSDIPVKPPAEGVELQTTKLSRGKTGTLPKNPDLKMQRKVESVAEEQLAIVDDWVEPLVGVSVPTDGDKTSPLSFTPIGIKATDFPHSAIALTPFPEISKIQTKLKGITTSRDQSGPSKLPADVESKIRPSDGHLSIGERINELGQPLLCSQGPDAVILKPPAVVFDASGKFSGNQSQPMDFSCSNSQDASHAKSGRQLAGGSPTGLRGKSSLDAEVSSPKPLDCSIGFQPSDLPVMKPGTDSGPSEVGYNCGYSNPNYFKGLGNLGFEFFKNPSPVELQSVGMKNLLDRGLVQIADSVDGYEKHRPGPSTAAGPLIMTQEDLDDYGKLRPGPSEAGPRTSIHEELIIGNCQLHQDGSPPSTQSNFQPKIHSEDIPSDEDEENNSAEDSDYFGTYHSDGDFSGDNDWYSEDSESAKFLKGKWRRGYTLQANISRRSLVSHYFVFFSLLLGL